MMDSECYLLSLEHVRIAQTASPGARAIYKQVLWEHRSRLPAGGLQLDNMDLHRQVAFV